MSRPFKEKGFTLARADLSTRVLVTAFLLCVLAGVWVAVLQYSGRSGGLGVEAGREWVLGNETDEDATVFRVAKGRTELLAFTHDHIFSLSMVLFVVLHLVQLTPLAQRTKIALIIVSFGGLAGTLGFPWLVRSGGEGSVWRVGAMIGSGTALLLGLAIGSAVVLLEMWVWPRWRRRRGRAEPPAADPMFPRGD